VLVFVLFPAHLQAAEVLLDAALAEVNGTFIAASDVALARALSLFGERPTSLPILRPEVEGMVTAALIEQEARQLRTGGTPEDVEQAWQEAAARVGGPAALEQWMLELGLDPSTVRQMVQADLRWRRYIDLRFRAFVFVTDEDMAKALGPGEHSPEARQAAAERLRREATDRDIAEWVTEARQRGTIRLADIPAGGMPLPFGPPH
jgi:hypothetical protein